jgi:hypothetical protein
MGEQEKRQATTDTWLIHGRRHQWHPTHTQYPRRGRAALGEEAERHNVCCVCGWSARRIIWERRSTHSQCYQIHSQATAVRAPKKFAEKFLTWTHPNWFEKRKMQLYRGELGDIYRECIAQKVHRGASRVLDFSAGAKVQTRACLVTTSIFEHWAGEWNFVSIKFRDQIL